MRYGSEHVPPVAVLGAGQWGKNLVRVMHQLGALRTICDTSPEVLSGMAKLYPGFETTSSVEQVFQDPQTPAVMVATPAETHYRLARQALQAGKDVFVEKPLSLRYTEGEELVELAITQERILMVGHLMEYHPAVTRLEQLLQRGDLGRIQYLYSNRLNLGRVRREENILWSFAPHDVAVILRLVSDLPIEVTATGGTYLQPNIPDLTVMTMHFYEGVRAHIFVSWLHPYKEQRLVVVGSQRMAVFDDMQPAHKLVVYDQGVEWVDDRIVPFNNGRGVVDVEMQEPLQAECQHFLDCIATRAQPLTDGQSALQVLRVLEAAQRSLQTSGAPVSLDAIRSR